MKTCREIFTDITEDPAASNWIKKEISVLASRDPVDALNDLECLMGYFNRLIRTGQSYILIGLNEWLQAWSNATIEKVSDSSLGRVEIVRQNGLVYYLCRCSDTIFIQPDSVYDAEPRDYTDLQAVNIDGPGIRTLQTPVSILKLIADNIGKAAYKHKLRLDESEEEFCKYSDLEKLLLYPLRFFGIKVSVPLNPDIAYLGSPEI